MSVTRKVVKRHAARVEDEHQPDSPQSLGETMDHLNERFEEIERRLKVFGVQAAVSLSDARLNDEMVSSLSFEKHGNRWRLMHVVEQKDFDNSWDRVDATPIVSASRGLRLEAAEQLPKLVGVVKKIASEQLDAARSALAKVDEVLLDLPEAEAEPEDEAPWGDDVPF